MQRNQNHELDGNGVLQIDLHIKYNSTDANFNRFEKKNTVKIR